jgi:phosphatidylinositol alpha-1,6-mannosyltransferase
VSDRTRKHIEEFSGISPEKYIIIPNGGDERVYAKIPDRDIQSYRQRFAGFSPLLLTVGNVSVRKGQEIVIRALPEIKEHFPNVLYIMAGKPTIQNEMQALADELGVGSNIHFTGIVSESELVKLYNAVDLFLMTSRRDTRTNEIEGFGIAVVEAALCGRAAVVSGNSGLAEAVEDGVTGFVTEENNPASVADAVIKLFTDDILRQQMERAAYTRANGSLTWEKVALQYDAVLKKLTGDTNGIRRN